MQLYITRSSEGFLLLLIKHTYNILSLLFTFIFSKSKVEETLGSNVQWNPKILLSFSYLTQSHPLSWCLTLQLGASNDMLIHVTPYSPPFHLIFYSYHVVPHHLLMCTKQLSMNSMQPSLQLRRTCAPLGNSCIAYGDACDPWGNGCVPKVFLKEMCVFLREMLMLPREMLVFLMVVFLGKSMSSLEKCSMGRCLCSLGEIIMFPKVFWRKIFRFLCKWLCYLERCLCLLREMSMFPMEVFVFFMRDGYVSMKMFLLVVLLGEMPMFSQEMAKKWLCCLLEWHFFKF